MVWTPPERKTVTGTFSSRGSFRGLIPPLIIAITFSRWARSAPALSGPGRDGEEDDESQSEAGAFSPQQTDDQMNLRPAVRLDHVLFALLVLPVCARPNRATSKKTLAPLRGVCGPQMFPNRKRPVRAGEFVSAACFSVPLACDRRRS